MIDLFAVIALGVFCGMWLFNRWEARRAAALTKRGMELLYPRKRLVTDTRSYAEKMAKYEVDAAAFRNEHGILEPAALPPRRYQSR